MGEEGVGSSGNSISHTLSVNVPDKNDIRLIFGVIQIIFDCFLYKIMLKRQFNYEAIL